MLLYPTAADWFATRAHASEIGGYVEFAESIDEGERERILQAAREYNENLPSGPLRDPFMLNEQGEVVDMREGLADYEAQLTGQVGGVMARVRVPAIGVDLPIYHGTDAHTLDRGVGHLYGSGLPVGGESTHAVLTAHSGLPSATLFTDLEQVAEGDVFFVDVLGEELAYQVDQITIVEPDTGDDLRQVPGEDYVTLLTCTPTGVNSHRLLVRGTRIDLGAAQADDAAQAVQIAAPVAGPGFPWWALLYAAGVGAAVAVVAPRRESAPATRTSPSPRLIAGRHPGAPGQWPAGGRPVQREKENPWDSTTS